LVSAHNEWDGEKDVEMGMGGGTLPYRRKSFLRTRMRMVARKPVRSRTVTIELKIENLDY